MPESPPPRTRPWLPGAAAPQLAAGEVHVWRASLEPERERREALARHLSAGEQARAARFRFERDRQRFSVARGLLRELLARYLGETPASLRLGESRHGKPFLEPAAAGAEPAPALEFNLSHTRGVCVFALARGARVGVDVEWITPLDDMPDLVLLNFSPREQQTWRALPRAARERAFFVCWTRKEAFVKAIGEGLSHPLDAFDVTLAPGEAPALTRLAGAAGECGRWSLRDLDPAPGVAGALAVEAANVSLHCFELDASR